MRFVAVEDEQTFLDRLNGIWINNYKLKVYKPRFDRKEVQPQKLVIRQHLISLGKESSTEKNKSFVEIIYNKDLNPSSAPIVDMIQYNTGVDDKTW